MNAMLKRMVPVILLSGCLMCCHKFPGIFFPAKDFVFSQLYQGPRPPSSVTERLAAGAEYPLTFTIHIGQGANSFYHTFLIEMFVNKLYGVLHIKEMKYEWENNQGVFIKDTDFIISPSSYFTQNGWYLTRIRDNLRVNFEKIFTGKKPGDEFLFTITLVYSLDGGPENTQVLEYEVETRKGKYVYQFF